ncbi:hypothetical protein Pmani_026545 [Petrolisthes manimaculis]|uniref:Ig-like domain-containing protein n=1 Tax=Petrolisthes manimaculis TaxID=1843537 RepID=A0AAE1P3X1_9EUCA|nr:hypothetical protein Pmani_026545 [Petrolisthes manimaculis]
MDDGVREAMRSRDVLQKELKHDPRTAGIRITEMHVPRLVRVASTVKLACRVDLQGASLYSLNWWRGSEQFYQFSPSSEDQITVWESHGITVDVSLDS